MIASIIAALISAAKTSQAVDSILQQLTDAYSAWKTEQNTKLRAEKDARNRELVAAAGGMRDTGAEGDPGKPAG
jgi:hypothetical protein